MKEHNHDAWITCENCGIEFSGRMHGDTCPICQAVIK